ncbi:hypothetical protein [Limnohabitans sp. Jir72]|uniref:hypothetical protein n=1 Tax=Limnohabitans sp. Jir72 TaxID=1977909 RepID=UPI000D35B390|nr:hypothetical protein [Limnohabitans sp. Jir72]PUE31359.1 hypothetical protein B9Z52_10675 [Limnohabitans sp. Jir72]
MNKIIISDLKLMWMRSSHGARLIALFLILNILLVLFFVIPLYENKNQLELKISQLKVTADKPPVLNVVTQSDPLEQLAEFEAGFPLEKTIPDILGQINDILLQSGLKISEAEYRIVDFPQSRLKAYQITMPIRGRYTQIIDASLMILNQIPSISLNNISFQRKLISDGQTEAIFSMTLYLRRI